MKPTDYLNKKIELLSNIDLKEIEVAINLISNKIADGKKILTCGNGGSANCASHYITDWVKMLNVYHKIQVFGFCLNDNVGLLTAYANDFDYSEVFLGQIKAVGQPGDLLIGISGSGNSMNVVNAFEEANRIGMDTLAIIGYDGGKLLKIAKHSVHFKSFDMQLCEDMHLMFGHMVMKSLCFKHD